MSNMSHESKLLIQFTSKSIRTRVNQLGKDLSKKYNCEFLISVFGTLGAKLIYNLGQKTIKIPISFSGIGLHTGVDAKVSIKPATPDTGIIFKRVDLNNNNIVYLGLGSNLRLPSYTNVIKVIETFKKNRLQIAIYVI